MSLIIPPVPQSVNPTSPSTPKTFRLDTDWLRPYPIWQKGAANSKARKIMNALHQQFESDLGGVACPNGGNANADPIYYARQYVVNTPYGAATFGLMYQMKLVDHAQVSYTC